MNHHDVEKEELKRQREEEMIASFGRKGSAVGVTADYSYNPLSNAKAKPTVNFNRVHRFNVNDKIELLKGVEKLYFIKKFTLIGIEHIHAVIVHPIGSNKLSDTSFDLGCSQLAKHDQVTHSQFVTEIYNNFKGK